MKRRRRPLEQGAKLIALFLREGAGEMEHHLGARDRLSQRVLVRGGEFVRRKVEAGDPNFIKMWNELGGMERFDRRRRLRAFTSGT